MIRTLRTYRTLPALLATVMVLGVGLPVLCQVCAPSEAAAAEGMDMHAAHQADNDTDAPAHCLHGHTDASEGVEASHDAQSCDDTACTMTVEEPAPAVQTERMVLAVHDAPTLVARAITVSHAVPASPTLARSSGPFDYHPRISIRLQTASFLL